MKNRPKKPLISIFTTSVKRWNLDITQCSYALSYAVRRSVLAETSTLINKRLCI